MSSVRPQQDGDREEGRNPEAVPQVGHHHRHDIPACPPWPITSWADRCPCGGRWTGGGAEGSPCSSIGSQT